MSFRLLYIFILVFSATFFSNCKEEEKTENETNKLQRTKVSFFTHDSLLASEAFISIFDGDSTYSIRSLNLDSTANKYINTIIIKSKADSLNIKRNWGFFNFDTIISNDLEEILLDLKNLKMRYPDGNSLVKKINNNPEIEIKLSYSGCFYYKNFRLFYNQKTSKVKFSSIGSNGIYSTSYAESPQLKLNIISAINKQETHIIENKKQHEKNLENLILTDCFNLSTCHVSISIKVNNNYYSFDRSIYCDYKELINLEKELATICNHKSYFK